MLSQNKEDFAQVVQVASPQIYMPMIADTLTAAEPNETLSHPNFSIIHANAARLISATSASKTVDNLLQQPKQCPQPFRASLSYHGALLYSMRRIHGEENGSACYDMIFGSEQSVPDWRKLLLVSDGTSSAPLPFDPLSFVLRTSSSEAMHWDQAALQQLLIGNSKDLLLAMAEARGEALTIVLESATHQIAELTQDLANLTLNEKSKTDDIQIFLQSAIESFDFGNLDDFNKLISTYIAAGRHLFPIHKLDFIQMKLSKKAFGKDFNNVRDLFTQLDIFFKEFIEQKKASSGTIDFHTSIYTAKVKAVLDLILVILGADESLKIRTNEAIVLGCLHLFCGILNYDSLSKLHQHLKKNEKNSLSDIISKLTPEQISQIETTYGIASPSRQDVRHNKLSEINKFRAEAYNHYKSAENCLADNLKAESPFLTLLSQLLAKINIANCYYDPQWMGIEEVRFHIRRKNTASKKINGPYAAQVIYNEHGHLTVLPDRICFESLCNKIRNIYQKKQTTKKQFVYYIAGKRHGTAFDIAWSESQQRIEVMYVESTKSVVQYFLLLQLKIWLNAQYIPFKIISCQAQVQTDNSSCVTIALCYTSILSHLSFAQLESKSIPQPTFKSELGITTQEPLEGIVWIPNTALGISATLLNQKKAKRITEMQTLDSKGVEWMERVESRCIAAGASPEGSPYLNYRRIVYRNKTLTNPWADLSVDNIFTWTKSKSMGQALRKLATDHEGPLYWLRFLLTKATPEQKIEPSSNGRTPLLWARHHQKETRAKVIETSINEDEMKARAKAMC